MELISYFSLHTFHLRPFFFCPIPFDEFLWYVGARRDGVTGCSIAIPSYDKLHICVFAHMTYNLVECVFTVAFYIFLSVFCFVVIASCSTSLVMIFCTAYYPHRSSRCLLGMHGCRMGPHCVGVLSNTSQSPFSQQLLQLTVVSQHRTIDQV